MSKQDYTKHPAVTEYGGAAGRGRLVTRKEAKRLFAAMKRTLAIKVWRAH